MIAQAGEARRTLRGGIVLPAPAAGRARAPLDRTALDDALEAGRSLGFVPRDPQDRGRGTLARRPGPRRKEEQDRLSVAGPRRVTDAFRTFCTRLALTHWEGLERLMRAGPPGGAGPASRSARGGADGPEADGAATRPADPTTLAVPREMMAWVEARVRSARYLDAGDYVRELIRRDQADFGTRRALESALADAAAPTDGFDLAAFARLRSEA